MFHPSFISPLILPPIFPPSLHLYYNLPDGAKHSCQGQHVPSSLHLSLSSSLPFPLPPSLPSCRPSALSPFSLPPSLASYYLPDGPKHSCQGQQGCHGHGNSSRDRLKYTQEYLNPILAHLSIPITE